MLDNWVITDADPVWDFRVEIRYDAEAGRPENNGDVYDADMMLRKSGEEAARWARDAVKAWERDEWCFAVITVTPVRKDSGVVFAGSADSLGGCDYGWLPGDVDDKPTNTADHAYMRTA